MKKLLILFLLAISISLFSQTNSDYFIPDSLIDYSNNSSYKITAGTCASPNGNMNSIGAPPASYAALQAGGYCNPSGTYGSSGTVCWSFTPTQTSVTINSGYSTTGCFGIGFGGFTLYQCSPSCAVVGAGLSFAVTAGQCYTWCMNYNGIGGACTFNDFCPYYQQFTVLPIELSYFAGSNQGNINVLQWKTEIEKNNDYFVLEISNDALNWSVLANIKGNGNTNSSITYNYKHEYFSNIINYYRLKQIDYNGTFKYHGIIAINNLINKDNKIINIKNILGQDVDENYNGIKIIYYSDGSVIKQF